MLERDCLFMSGESGLTMKCVFRRERWMHTCSASTLLFENNVLHRKIFPREKLNALIFYADMDDKKLEMQNLETIKKSKVPCWPNIDSLIDMCDRFDVLQRCIDEKLIDNEVVFFDQKMHKSPLDFPFVVKMGNVQRGQNKFLIDCQDTWDVFETTSRSNIEPYFVGTSIRALIVGDQTFGIKIDNTTSWIKNTTGAEISIVNLNDNLIRHARSCAKLFNLDCCGVDYIVEQNGKFHFLECNQFPGLSNISNQITHYVEEFLDNKMSRLENFNMCR